MFKVTTHIPFKGMPSSKAKFGNQVVEPFNISFFKGKVGRETQSDKINIKIESRVFVKQSEMTSFNTIEAELVTLKTSHAAKVTAWKAKSALYGTDGKASTAAQARALSLEGTAIETQIKAKNAEHDHSSYYVLETIKEVDTVAELNTINNDISAAVKLDDLFSGATTVDL